MENAVVSMHSWRGYLEMGYNQVSAQPIKPWSRHDRAYHLPDGHCSSPLNTRIYWLWRSLHIVLDHIWRHSTGGHAQVRLTFKVVPTLAQHVTVIMSTNLHNYTGCINYSGQFADWALSTHGYLSRCSIFDLVHSLQGSLRALLKEYMCNLGTL